MAENFPKNCGDVSPVYHPFRRACEGNAKSVELLLPKSDVKATTKYGWSALMYAAYYGYDKVIELLIPKSDVKATDMDGYSALMYAALHDYSKSVELLLPFSDVKAVNHKGKSALRLAEDYFGYVKDDFGYNDYFEYNESESVRLIQEHICNYLPPPPYYCN